MSGGWLFRIKYLLRDTWEDIRTFTDKWNVIIGLILLGITAWVGEGRWRTGAFQTNRLLVLFTAAYVLTSFNQMREARKNRVTYEGTPVQPHFEYSEEWGFKVPYLRNFGYSPAVSFQALAQIEYVEGGSKTVKEHKRRQDPVNLDPGQQIELMNQELVEMLEAPEEFPEDVELSLYYGHDSIHSGATPVAAGRDKTLKELVREYPNPRSIKLAEIQACYDEAHEEKDNETTH